MKGLKSNKIVCLVLVLSLCVNLFPMQARAEKTLLETTEVSSMEEDGFDENAHGEVVDEGTCGTNVRFKLYADETLYIYNVDGNGSGEASGKHIFSSKYISNVYIEDGIISIGDSLFYECKDMKTVRIPDGLKNIGRYAFAYCESLNDIHIPESVESIGDCGFFYCKSLTDIVIPKEVTEIQESTFSCCNKLKNITLSEKLKTIGKNAFHLCSAEEIILPDGLEIIGESAFSYSQLKSIIIPSHVTLIDSRAFSDCWQLKKVLVPDSVKKIRNEAFSNCTFYCNENSEAERYAQENGLEYKPISLWEHEHAYEETITKEPTCTESGIRTYICSCGDEYTEEISATGHKIVSDPAVAPTATDEGKTEGSHCEICGEVLMAQETIPAVGTKNTFHGSVGVPVKISITCNENDEFTFECADNCGMTYRYTGYSSIRFGSFVSYSKGYELIFYNAGEHIISVYKNGFPMEYDKIIVSETTINPTESTAPPSEIRYYGDVDLDGAVSAADALTILRHVVKLQILTDPTALLLADPTEDDSISASDALWTLQCVVKLREYRYYMK